ncbi:sodium-independent sulfate anion transporter-like isoform X1 [Leptidea sinapis]|uniref:sodium-independent sulfate anion transporter-like isoform X1 n=1 Tax=Leptidea sinapis TaxID=189913 RepID=UPI002123A3B8|nr:sodium-independent sulfate anion transporter-like isoform X1 [Leptidea sinapis]
MDSDDPRQPLLGHRAGRSARRTMVKLCGLQSWRRRIPITVWLPNYKLEYLFRDLIAGITVGLTSIPQGIAYAMIAGLPAQVGLYSSIFPGLVYAIFSSCKDVTVGPTAILAALLAKYVAKSPDFAYLASMLTGFVILCLGVLQLGFLLDFISKPVISGFTTAAALQISAAQLKSLFRIAGASGDTFISAVINFITNIKTVQPWDTLLGFASIIVLLIMKRSHIKTSPTDNRWRVTVSNTWLYVIRARNALVVFVSLALAYVLYRYGLTPFKLTGTIKGGLPRFGPPPFTTVVNNQTLSFGQMLGVFGAEGLAMPLVAILESIAIAKAFAGSNVVDSSQEMLAIGACNLVSSFAQSMPATGSFTRTALNHASGVITPAGSAFKACLVLLAVTLLAEAFYFIPRATLAGIIMVAMVSIIDLTIVKRLWTSSKSELCVWLLTVIVGCCVGLEYGIAAGAAVDAIRAAVSSARPHVHCEYFKINNYDCILMRLVGTLSYSSAEYVAKFVRSRALDTPTSRHVIIFDTALLRAIDFGVAENLTTAIVDLQKHEHTVFIWNLDSKLHGLFTDIHPDLNRTFVAGSSIESFIGLPSEQQSVTITT